MTNSISTPATYLEMTRAEVPAYDELQDAVADATAVMVAYSPPDAATPQTINTDPPGHMPSRRDRGGDHLLSRPRHPGSMTPRFCPGSGNRAGPTRGNHR